MKFCFFHRWTAAIAAAIVGIGLLTAAPEQTQAAETLTIHYRDSDGNPRTREVAEDVGYLRFDASNSITLPEGLTKLHTLEIDFSLLPNLTLPKDIGKDADWPFRLIIANGQNNPSSRILSA